MGRVVNRAVIATGWHPQFKAEAEAWANKWQSSLKNWVINPRPMKNIGTVVALLPCGSKDGWACKAQHDEAAEELRAICEKTDPGFPIGCYADVEWSRDMAANNEPPILESNQDQPELDE